MEKKHLKIIEAIAADGKHVEALLLLDHFDENDLEASDLIEVANLKARIYVQSGEYGKARTVWEKMLSENENNSDAKQGIALLDKLKKNKFFAFRIGAARILSNHGKLLLGIAAVLISIIWLTGLNNKVNESLKQMTAVKVSCAPGGEFFKTVENRFLGISLKNDEIKNEIIQSQEMYQLGLKEQQDRFLQQLTKYSEQLQQDYSQRIEYAVKNFQANSIQMEKDANAAISRIASLEAGQRETIKRDSELSRNVLSIKEKMDGYYKRFDHFSSTTNTIIERQENTTNKIKVIEDEISILKKNCADIRETVFFVKKNMAGFHKIIDTLSGKTEAIIAEQETTNSKLKTLSDELAIIRNNYMKISETFFKVKPEFPEKDASTEREAANKGE